MEVMSEEFPDGTGVCLRAYTLASMEVFNESNICMCLMDFSPGTENIMIWANQAYLDTVDQSLDEFRSLKASMRSMFLREQHLRYHETIQVQQCSDRSTKTMQWQGKWMSTCWMMRPLRLIDAETERVVIFCTVLPAREDRMRALCAMVDNDANTPQCLLESKLLEVVAGNEAAQTRFECNSEFRLLRDRTQLHISDIFACFSWDDPQQEQAAIARVRKLTPDDPPIEMELRQGTHGVSGPEPRWKRLVFSTVEGPSESVYLVLTEVDISEVVRVREGQAALAEALQAKNEFLEAACYELRTPLHSIMSLSEMCTPKDRCTERAVAAIEASAVRLNSVVDDMLLYASVEGAGGDCGEALPLRSLVECVREALLPHVPAHVEVVNDVRHGIVAHGDLASVKQVLLKTVNNQLEHAGEGAITFGAKEAEESISLLIADSTGAVPMRTFANVWEAQDGARQRRDPRGEEGELLRRTASSGSVDACCGYGGLGLRMAMVKHLVECQRGKVEVVALEGREAVQITLPRSSRAGGRGAQGAGAGEGAGEGRRGSSGGARGGVHREAARWVEAAGRRGEAGEEKAEERVWEGSGSDRSGEGAGGGAGGGDEAVRRLEERVRKQQTEIRRLREQVGRLQGGGGSALGSRLERTATAASDATTAVWGGGGMSRPGSMVFESLRSSGSERREAAVCGRGWDSPEEEEEGGGLGTGREDQGGVPREEEGGRRGGREGAGGADEEGEGAREGGRESVDVESLARELMSLDPQSCQNWAELREELVRVELEAEGSPPSSVQGQPRLPLRLVECSAPKAPAPRSLSLQLERIASAASAPASSSGPGMQFQVVSAGMSGLRSPTGSGGGDGEEVEPIPLDEVKKLGSLGGAAGVASLRALRREAETASIKEEIMRLGSGGAGGCDAALSPVDEPCAIEFDGAFPHANSPRAHAAQRRSSAGHPPAPAPAGVAGHHDASRREVTATATATATGAVATTWASPKDSTRSPGEGEGGFWSLRRSSAWQRSKVRADPEAAKQAAAMSILTGGGTESQSRGHGGAGSASSLPRRTRSSGPVLATGRPIH